MATAQFTWTYDAPSNTYKSHAMSANLRMAAIEKSVFAEHVATEEGFGRKSGDTVTINRVRNVTEPTSAVLNETDRIPEDVFQLSSTSITVQELGRAIPFTSLSNDLSKYDLENPTQKKLRDQMGLTLDTIYAKAFRSAQVKYQPTGATSYSTTTNGAFSTAVTTNMNVWHLESIRDLMFDTYYVPTAENDDYIGIFRTKSIRGIKRDPDFEEWHKYTDPAVKFNSEQGRMEQIRLIETNHANAMRSNSYMGEGVVFGNDAVRQAVAMDPELRASLPEDFGRSKAVAWYGIMAAASVWDTANAGEANIIHVGSNDLA